MLAHKKTRILYLFRGPVYRPDLPDYKDRFEMLSEQCEGEIYSWSTDQEFHQYPIGTFVYRGLVCSSEGVIKKWLLARHIISNALKYHRHQAVDAVICYDPLFTGVLGVVLKVLTGAKLIIEINNFSFAESLRYHYGNSFNVRVKIWMAGGVQKIVCSLCDRIRILTEKQEASFGLSRWRGKLSVFHDFVPTHYFEGGGVDKKEILFIGYPFYLKGVDVLIRAFENIQDQYPEFVLRLIGHRLREDAQDFFEKQQWDEARVVFHKGMSYEQLRDYFLGCYCFVLPSRTDGMAKVLIEAMASGKPVIGSRVGGTPDIIEDGRNGFLFEPENVDDLTRKLKKILSDAALAKRMGMASREVIAEKFSSENYIRHFSEMIRAMGLSGR